MGAEDAALRHLVEGTATDIGADFFPSLVRHLAEALGVRYAFVSRFVDDNRQAHVIAFHPKGTVPEPYQYPLPGTPCAEVLAGDICHHPKKIQSLFPDDADLTLLEAESYLGVPLPSPLGEPLGHLAVIDTEMMSAEPRFVALMRVFAARARAELVRLDTEGRLRASVRRQHSLMSAAPVLLFEVDAGGVVTFCEGDLLRTVFPSGRGGVIGKNIADLPRIAADCRRALAGEEVATTLNTAGKVIAMRYRPRDDGVVVVCSDASELVRLQEQNEYLTEQAHAPHEQLIGRSPAFLSVIEQVERVAATEATVLLLGETGTGKELIARAVHQRSARRNRPLVKVNCAALPVTLVESELFGHERGAFTGADKERAGRFELADGGTLFLDEVGDIPLDVQTKLLRVLQERELERVGGSETIKVDVRIIAATNRDLKQRVAEGEFREDLYYRLAVVPLSIPPLRERSADIVPLAQCFIDRHAPKLHRKVASLDAASAQRMIAYDWPGNIRELEHVVQRALILGDGDTLVIDDLLIATGDRGGHVGATLEDVERKHITATLAHTSWVVDGPKGAAKILELHPNTLRHRMKKLGITRPV